MKKIRVFPILLTFAMLVTLLTPNAAAASSQIVSDMSVKSEAALLVDMDTGTVLYDQKGEDKIYPASITKVMTALLVFQAIDAGKLTLDQVITADSTTWDGIEVDASTQNIQVGEQMSVKDLLYCLLVSSASEAANILAVSVSGSISSFVDAMNTEATALGCTNTHFTNPSGMPDDNHYSTCYDLYLIGKAAMQYPDFRTIVSSTEYSVEATNMSPKRHFYNTNALLSNLKYSGYVYSNCIGIKTGSTDAAGYCLLSAAQQDGKTLIAVVTGCKNETDSKGTIQRYQFSESSRLLQWGFDNFTDVTILDSTDPVGEVPVTLSSEADYVSAIPSGTLTAELPKDITADSFEKNVQLVDSMEAPIKQGDVLGTMTLTMDGKAYGTVNLVAANDVSRSELLYRKAQVKNFFAKWYKLLILGMIVLVVLIAVLRFVVFRGRRRYGNRGGGYSSGGYHGGRRRR